MLTQAGGLTRSRTVGVLIERKLRSTNHERSGRRAYMRQVPRGAIDQRRQGIVVDVMQ